MRTKHPLPKTYWIYSILTILSIVALFGNLIRTDSWTGDKEFSAFTQNDWHLFAIFIFEEIIILLLFFIFAVKSGKIARTHSKELNKYYTSLKYYGLKPGDYDDVWFDFDLTERAIIIKCRDSFVLYVQEFNEELETWENVNTQDSYSTLEELKKALFYEFDFFCEENTELDEHGNEIYKET